MNYSENEIQSIQISNVSILVFTHHYIEGMVGEGHNWTTCKYIDLSNNKIQDLEYDEVKAIYNSSKGLLKKQRIGFWQAMRPMSAKAKAKEMQRSYQDAISRVI